MHRWWQYTWWQQKVASRLPVAGTASWQRRRGVSLFSRLKKGVLLLYVISEWTWSAGAAQHSLPGAVTGTQVSRSGVLDRTFGRTAPTRRDAVGFAERPDSSGTRLIRANLVTSRDRKTWAAHPHGEIPLSDGISSHQRKMCMLLFTPSNIRCFSFVKLMYLDIF
jgi:hypothetical protein